MIVAISLSENALRRSCSRSRQSRDIAVQGTGTGGSIQRGVVPSRGQTARYSGDGWEWWKGSSIRYAPDWNFVGCGTSWEGNGRRTEDHCAVTAIGEDGVILRRCADCYGCNVSWESCFGEQGEICGCAVGVCWTRSLR